MSLSIKRKTTSPYHAQANGLVERMNGTLQNMLATFTRDETEWEEHLYHSVAAYRVSFHCGLGTSPYHIIWFRTQGTSGLDLAGGEGWEEEKSARFTILLQNTGGRSRAECWACWSHYVKMKTCKIVFEAFQTTLIFYLKKRKKNEQVPTIMCLHL